MVLYDHKAKLYFIGIEHLNRAIARRVINGDRNVRNVEPRDVHRNVLKGYRATFEGEGYSLALHANGKTKLLIYNAK